MTFDTITQRFKTVATGLKLNFGYAPFRDGKTPKTPYIAVSYPERKDFPGDNKAFVKISRIRILLVTAEKKPSLEASVEAAFEDLGISYSKEEEFYRDENVFVFIYETEELIDA